MSQRQLERLAAAGFQLLPAFQIQTHYVVERGGFVALVERCADDGFGQIGAPALLRDGVLCALLWRPEGPVFAAKGAQWPATEQQILDLRKFDAELQRALSD